MARINIEDDLESREQFWKLMSIYGDRDKCLGLLVRFFRLAQHRFGRREILTEKDLVDHGLTDMISSGWATPVEGGFEAIGSEKQFSWYRQKCDNGQHGKLGGIKKAKNTESNKINDLSYPTSTRDSISPSPLTLTLSPSLTLTNLNTNMSDSPKGKSRRVFDFESLYNKYPRKEGKQKGLLTCRVQIKTEADFSLLSKAIDSYITHCAKNATDPKYIKMFSTFMNSWRDWLDPQTGTAINLSENKKAADRAALMEKLK